MARLERTVGGVLPPSNKGSADRTSTWSASELPRALPHLGRAGPGTYCRSLACLLPKGRMHRAGLSHGEPAQPRVALEVQEAPHPTLGRAPRDGGLLSLEAAPMAGAPRPAAVLSLRSQPYPQNPGPERASSGRISERRSLRTLGPSRATPPPPTDLHEKPLGADPRRATKLRGSIFWRL